MRKRFLLLTCLVMSNSALAQGIGDVEVEPKSVNSKQPFKLIIKNAGETPACGLEVNLGDGTVRQVRGDNFPVTVEHTYQNDGTYAISVTGRGMTRGLKSLTACNGNKSLALQVGGGGVPAAVGSTVSPSASQSPPQTAQLEQLLKGMQQQMGQMQQQMNQMSQPSSSNTQAQGQPAPLQQKSNNTGNLGRTESAADRAKLVESLNVLATALWTHQWTFKISEKQWEFNTKYGAPPISSGFRAMVNAEIPQFYKMLSDCSVKNGGAKIDTTTVEKFLFTSGHPDVEDNKKLITMFRAMGVEAAPVKVPLKKDLNDSANSEMTLRLELNRLYANLGIKTKKDWCESLKL